jgi:hypothetical protein
MFGNVMRLVCLVTFGIKILIIPFIAVSFSVFSGCQSEQTDQILVPIAPKYFQIYRHYRKLTSMAGDGAG